MYNCNDAAKKYKYIYKIKSNRQQVRVYNCNDAAKKYKYEIKSTRKQVRM